LSFLNWLGVLWLALVPLLVLVYMFRPKRRPTRVPSLRLWQTLPHVERSTSQLRPPPITLLLVLQVILLAAGALALAQPALTAPGAGLQVVAIDASGSMLTADVGATGTRFDAARAEARKAVDTLGLTGKVTLLRVGANVTTECSACDQTAFLQAVDNLQPGAGVANMSTMLEVASGLARHLNDGSVLPLTVISDGEFAAVPPAGGERLSLRFVQVGDSSASDSVSVTALSARRPPDGRAGWIAFARIENRSSRSLDITVKALADTVPLPDRTQTVPANGSVGITWQVAAGTFSFTIDVTPGDALSEDDHATIFLPASGQTKVLVASDQPALYTRALGVIDGLASVTTTLDGLSTAATVPGYAFTVVDGGLPATLPDGGLLLVNPTGDTTAENAQAAADALGLTLTGKATDVHAGNVTVNHPLVAGTDLSALVVADANRIAPPDWLETVVDSAAGPLVLAGEKDGRRVVVFTFDPRRSNLPKLAAFPLLIANVADWLYPLSDMQAVPPGAALRLPSGSIVQTPDGRSVDTGSTGLFVDTDHAGIFKVVAQGQSSPTVQFAVNVADNGTLSAPSTNHPELDRPQQGTSGEQSHSDLWFAFAGFSLSLLLVEWLFYCWKRGSV
jgi:hypothetical protein